MTLTAQEQLDRIARGTEQIEPKNELLQRLQASIDKKKPLRVKYGIDPTGIDVHLGHTVPLRKLRLFQELGHHPVLIIGNYTALVGDPSGRDQTRARLTQEQVEANAKDYLKQIERIIDITKTEIHYNGEWFSKFQFLDVLSLTSKITMQRMLERDDFSKRKEAGSPIYLHECLYPLMQGHDSVEIQADIELGGSEQLFSLMVGRHLQANAGQNGQICITLPILRGLDGTRRMGKSLGNYVGVGESAREQFGKTMSIPDELMPEWFQLLTDLPSTEINQLCNPIQTHPMAAKKRLAHEIVQYYHGQVVALQVAEDWEKQFSKQQDPDQIDELFLSQDQLKDNKISVVKLLVLSGLAASNTEARQKIGAGAVNYGPERTKCTDVKMEIELTSNLVLRLGRKIKRIIIAQIEK